jgi:hypothetical protein
MGHPAPAEKTLSGFSYLLKYILSTEFHFKELFPADAHIR